MQIKKNLSEIHSNSVPGDYYEKGYEIWHILHHLCFSVHSNGPNNSTFSFPHFISSLPFHSNWPSFTLHLLLSCFSVPGSLTHARPRQKCVEEAGVMKDQSKHVWGTAISPYGFLVRLIMQVNPMSYEFGVIKEDEVYPLFLSLCFMLIDAHCEHPEPSYPLVLDKWSAVLLLFANMIYFNKCQIAGL